MIGDGALKLVERAMKATGEGTLARAGASVEEDVGGGNLSLGREIAEAEKVTRS